MFETRVKLICFQWTLMCCILISQTIQFAKSVSGNLFFLKFWSTNKNFCKHLLLRSKYQKTSQVRSLVRNPAPKQQSLARWMPLDWLMKSLSNVQKIIENGSGSLDFWGKGRTNRQADWQKLGMKIELDKRLLQQKTGWNRTIFDNLLHGRFRIDDSDPMIAWGWLFRLARSISLIVKKFVRIAIEICIS